MYITGNTLSVHSPRAFILGHIHSCAYTLEIQHPWSANQDGRRSPSLEDDLKKVSTPAREFKVHVTHMAALRLKLNGTLMHKGNAHTRFKKSRDAFQRVLGAFAAHYFQLAVLLQTYVNTHHNEPQKK